MDNLDNTSVYLDEFDMEQVVARFGNMSEEELQAVINKAALEAGVDVDLTSLSVQDLQVIVAICEQNTQNLIIQ